MKKEKYSCLVFGEGKKDNNFLKTLIDLRKFKYHTSKWTFNYGNASGSSPAVVLEKCYKESFGYAYDLILCFMDIDKLKEDFPQNWKDEKKILEQKYKNIKIIWQINNAEDEYKKVLGNIEGKHKINQKANKEVYKFINSNFWKRILKSIKDKENSLIKC